VIKDNILDEQKAVFQLRRMDIRGNFHKKEDGKFGFLEIKKHEGKVGIELNLSNKMIAGSH
jgi:hypothetical protein